MRKHIINAAEPDPLQTCEWLNIEKIARVEISSEDPQYPIESAFKLSSSPCAGQIAQQVRADRSFDSNGILIPEIRRWSSKITKST
jgi:hypothetical protein